LREDCALVDIQKSGVAPQRSDQVQRVGHYPLISCPFEQLKIVEGNVGELGYFLERKIFVFSLLPQYLAQRFLPIGPNRFVRAAV
jgi:hypothetical protein